MAYLNKVFLIGNLTREPELRVTPKGTSICQFGLAVNRQFKDESGASRDETTFVDIEAWASRVNSSPNALQKVRRALWKVGCASISGRTRPAARSVVD